MYRVTSVISVSYENRCTREMHKSGKSNDRLTNKQMYDMYMYSLTYTYI